MKKALMSIVVLLASATFAFALDGKVTQVIDGDSVEVNGRQVRVWGIDAPEYDQPQGQAAKEFATPLLAGKQVHVVEKTTDRYGRLVGEIKIGGHDYGTILIQEGLAWWYVKYAPSATHLAQAEREARNARKGIWASGNPTPPWEWRKMKR